MSCLRIAYSTLILLLLLPIGLVDTVAQDSGSEMRTGISQDPTPSHSNRLINEKSPYLLLHAHNPVDWYPWGEEAFSKARRENKPIFLSIGYYTCHWCHVMERESFSNVEIAAILNRWFVSVKVDREERPDVDRVYLAFVEAMTGAGGWPMNVVLTPDLKPFFGGTYFPPTTQQNKEGLLTLLPRLADIWKTKQDELKQSADKVIQQLEAQADPTPSSNTTLDAQLPGLTYERIKRTYDQQYAGFGSGAKFPRPLILEFLFRDWEHAHRPDSLNMALRTLRALSSGGIHDQLGGGFHRYTTDSGWRVPHFEKMLYDQAQLATAFAEAYQITHEANYASVARETIDFTLREMMSPEGGFYSGIDADSVSLGGKSRREGAFYTWTHSDVERLLGAEAASLFEFRFGIAPGGNIPAELDTQGEFAGENVLYAKHTIAETAKQFAMSDEQVDAALASAREKLSAFQRDRPRPAVDNKILTAWNGCMLTALARAGEILDEPKYLHAAQRLSDFLQNTMYDPATHQLTRRYREGRAEIPGFVEDYAFLIQGLLDLYEASFDVRQLHWARELQKEQDALFWDKTGGSYLTSGTRKSVILRTRDIEDDAEAAPNSVAAMNLVRLWQYAGDASLKQKADILFASVASRLARAPEASPYLMSAFAFRTSNHKQIVIAGDPDANDTQQMLRLVRSRYIPNRIVMLVDGGEKQKQLKALQPLVGSMIRISGKATAYICEGYVCKVPTNDPEVMAKQLDSQ